MPIKELEEALDRQRETGQALTWRRRSSVSGSSESGSQRQLVAPYTTGKRVVHQSRKHKRIIDQENTEVRKLFHFFLFFIFSKINSRWPILAGLACHYVVVWVGSSILPSRISIW